MGRDSDFVVAKLNYIPSGLHELPLYKGEKLTVVDSNGDWWRVKNALGQTGLIPSSYIRPQSADSFLSKLFRRSSRSRKSQDKKQRPPPDLSITPQSVPPQNVAITNSEKFPRASSDPDSKPFQENALIPTFLTPTKDPNYFDTSSADQNNQTHHELVDFVAKVRYNYKAQRPDELDLKPGEDVVVLERASDGWWRGVNQNTNLSGWFPSNYVIQNPTGLNDENKCDSGVFAGSGANNVANVGAVPMIQGVAVTSYIPKTQLELRVNKGDQLCILRECSHSSSFWEARNQSNNGETGLVLKSYVQISASNLPLDPVVKSNLSTPLSVSVDSPQKLALVDFDKGEVAGAVGGIGSSLALPFELPPKMGMFKNEDWYFGKVFRNQCEILFKYYGDFGDYLIRDSESNPGDYTLSLKANIKNRHFLIKSEGVNKLKIGTKDFPSMGELITHYKSNAIFTDVNGTRLVLVKPLRIPGKFI